MCITKGVLFHFFFISFAYVPIFEASIWGSKSPLLFHNCESGELRDDADDADDARQIAQHGHLRW